MKYDLIEGVEIIPKDTIESPGYIYISEGVFVGPSEKKEVEKTQLMYKCDDFQSLINIYYNPDLEQYLLSEEKYSTPHTIYGYHLGSLVLMPENDNGVCIRSILHPDNGDITHIRYYNDDYNCDFNLDPDIRDECTP